MNTPRIEIRTAVQGRHGKRWWFVVIADNGEIIATSEMYTRRTNAVHGARALIYVGKKLFENPAIVDAKPKRKSRR